MANSTIFGVCQAFSRRTANRLFYTTQDERDLVDRVSPVMSGLDWSQEQFKAGGAPQRLPMGGRK